MNSNNISPKIMNTYLYEMTEKIIISRNSEYGQCRTCITDTITKHFTIRKHLYVVSN